ncbi:MAG: hypothetical protein PHF93_11950 [Acidobacteriota bacterium]|jgi:hypothetical protein|nr:hypothetical protein [Acidobacteriota bacterium]OQB57694.1 MAG: hypothetical protein BWX98_01279 [Candidatus Aminicenantes bacterium ADurb.Bin147]HNQ80857.1 hypothetical protein [Candidatus Aminicenantes bacterium]MDD8011555.1 hypothetical protein [Acidobacteriota bacterium]MDD8030229.1 hypothetical protein [Acidobacteriota bacterium]
MTFLEFVMRERAGTTVFVPAILMWRFDRPAGFLITIDAGRRDETGDREDPMIVPRDGKTGGVYFRYWEMNSSTSGMPP